MSRESRVREEAVGHKRAWFFACLLLTAAVVALAFGGFPTIHTNTSSDATDSPKFANISPSEFREAISTMDPFVVDVHIPEQTHLPGTDAFIPYNQVTDRLAEFPEDKTTEILVYCRSGSMSAEASRVLAAAGYTNVKNLIGGVIAYREFSQDVELTPDTRDLGRVTYGDVATTTFEISNNTGTPLLITRISTSCTCTKAVVEKSDLEPYGNSVVDVSFDPAVHKDETDLGDVIRTIYIDTDNLNFPRVEATITAQVIKQS